MSTPQFSGVQELSTMVYKLNIKHKSRNSGHIKAKFSVKLTGMCPWGGIGPANSYPALRNFGVHPTILGAQEISSLVSETLKSLNSGLHKANSSVKLNGICLWVGFGPAKSLCALRNSYTPQFLGAQELPKLVHNLYKHTNLAILVILRQILSLN